jgi:hypothetical protein
LDYPAKIHAIWFDLKIDIFLLFSEINASLWFFEISAADPGGKEKQAWMPRQLLAGASDITPDPGS